MADIDMNEVRRTYAASREAYKRYHEAIQKVIQGEEPDLDLLTKLAEDKRETERVFQDAAAPMLHRGARPS